MAMNATMLLAVGILLGIYVLAIPSPAGEQMWLFDKIFLGFQKVLGTVAWAALAAAAIVICLPTFARQDLTSQNLRQLNETLETCHAWLDKAWILMLAAAVSLLAAAWAGRREVDAVQAKLAGQAFKGTTTAKAVLGILAASSFIGADFKERLADRAAEAEAQQVHLKKMQLALFSKAERVLAREVAADILAQAATQSSSFQQVRAAYSIAAPYLPQPVQPAQAQPVDLDMATPAAAAAARPAQDIFSATSASDAAPTDSQTDWSGPSSDPGGKHPDLSAREIAAYSHALDQVDAGQGALIEEVAKLAVDHAFADPIKEHLLHLDNPLLEALASAVLDPTFVDPLAKVIATQADRLLSTRFDWPAAQTRLRLAAQDVTAQVAGRISKVKPPLPGPLGDARWDEARSNLEIAVHRGLQGKDRQVQALARDEVAKAAQVRNALRVVLVSGPDRSRAGEAAFAEYLGRNPPYAALWGYAAITFAPLEEKGRLRKIAAEDMDADIGSDQMRQIADELRRTIGKAALGDAAAQKWLEREHLDPLADSRLTSDASDAALASVIRERRGAHPLDGYRLYFRSTQPSQEDAAAAYFESQAVGDYVDQLCPRTPGGGGS